jgi:hypothetical protein
VEPDSGPGLKVNMRFLTKGAGGERGEVRGTFNLDHKAVGQVEQQGPPAMAKTAKPPKRRKELG